ncbi:MAG: hypothetical protein MUF71_06980 [Candidatus Kapabacteria bacterium]|jgi:hypothetical protein|nr:hypothetical protein [Candidatus Kapabacteria bacterium]
MSSRTKSFLTIAGTLVLGMVLGGLLTGAVIGKRARTVGGILTNEKRFVAMAERLIQPQEHQRDTLGKLLNSYGAAFAGRNRAHQQWQAHLLDSLRRDIMPLLKPDQQERFGKRLATMEAQRKKFFDQHNTTEP